MKIAIVWKNDYPWDIRVEKIARTLYSFGHDVHIIASNLRKENNRDNIDGITVHRLYAFKRNIVNRVISLPVFFNPFWLYSIYKVCKQNNIELIIIRDLPLALNGIVVGKMLKCRTIFDMAELYSALWKDLPRSLFNFFFKNPSLAGFLEKKLLKLFDHIFVVVEEAKSTLEQLNIDGNKISIVSNTPNLSDIELLTKSGNMVEWENKVIVLYHGYLNKARGIEVVIRAMPELIEKYNQLLLVLVGDGDSLGSYKKLCKELDIENHVIFTGWVSFEQIPQLINAASICVIPHFANDHKNTTVPNKLFDYMACKKPVIVSDAAPLKRIVNEEKCGLVFKSGNISNFIKAISLMLSDRHKMSEMGQRGKEAVIRKYNWSQDSLVMKSVVEKIG